MVWLSQHFTLFGDTFWQWRASFFYRRQVIYFLRIQQISENLESIFIWINIFAIVQNECKILKTHIVKVTD